MKQEKVEVLRFIEPSWIIARRRTDFAPTLREIGFRWITFISVIILIVAVVFWMRPLKPWHESFALSAIKIAVAIPIASIALTFFLWTYHRLFDFPQEIVVSSGKLRAGTRFVVYSRHVTDVVATSEDGGDQLLTFILDSGTRRIVGVPSSVNCKMINELMAS